MKKTVLHVPVILILAAFTSTIHAGDLLKVTVVNNSDVSTDDRVYVQMIGIDPAGSGKLGHIDLATSTWVAISESDNTVTPPSGPWGKLFTNYARKMSDLAGATHTRSFNIPHIISGRVNISLDPPTYFHINPGPGLERPSAVDPALPNYRLIFDKVELDWENGQAPFFNTTTVDFFSIPFLLELKLSNGASAMRGFTKSKKEIMDSLQSLPSVWQNGIVKNGAEIVRFIAPQNLLDPNPFANYFDSYVAQCWTYYTSNALTLQNQPNTAPWSATGQVVGGAFTFTVAGTGEVVTINNLAGQGKHIFGCDGAGYLFTTGSDSIPKQGIITQMGAALNRSVLLNIKDATTWWNNPAQFYTQDATNQYSKVLHGAAYQGYCYGFPYDDVGNFSTGISGNATEAEITIGSMDDRFPVDLTSMDTTFSQTDTILVTADVPQISTPFFPAVWVEMPDGRNLYFVKGRGFVSSPTPYLSGGPFVVNRPINDYSVLSGSFTAPPGNYVLNGAAVDAARTTSVNNIVYIDGIDRTELTVQ